MTVVALERIDHAPDYIGPLPLIMVIADSRIRNGTITSTNTAPKIFPVNAFASDKDGFSASFPYFGFAYAGSSLAANVTHATATHCLMNLFTSGPLAPPWTLHVANVYRDAARLQIGELASRLKNPREGFFKGVVFGYSRLSNRVQAFSLTPRLEPTFDVDLEEIDFTQGYVRFGDGASAFDQTRAALTTKTYTPSCIKVVEEMIRTQAAQSVGGYVQAAAVDRDGLQLQHFIDFEPGSDEGVVRFMGVDIAQVSKPTGYKFGRHALTSGGPDGKPVRAGAVLHTTV